jgi:hypothetical protein
MLANAQERVNLASKIVACEDAESRTQKNNQWFADAASQAELDLDDTSLDEGQLGANRHPTASY